MQCVCANSSLCMCLYVLMCVCVFLRVSTCMWVSVWVCLYLCVWLCVCVCLCVSVCVGVSISGVCVTDCVGPRAFLGVGPHLLHCLRQSVPLYTSAQPGQLFCELPGTWSLAHISQQEHWGHSCGFMWVLGINPRSYTVSASPPEPSPLPHRDCCLKYSLIILKAVS